MLDIFSSYLSTDEAKDPGSNFNQIDIDLDTQSHTEHGEVTTQDDTISSESSQPNGDAEKDKDDTPGEEEDAVLAADSWFFNPLTYFDVKKEAAVPKSKNESLESSDSHEATLNGLEDSEHSTKSKTTDGETSAPFVEASDSDSVVEVAPNEDNGFTDSSSLERDASLVDNASYFEGSLNLPPKLNLDLTKKEAAKATTAESISPVYKLIKNAFSELQLFSKACKLSSCIRAFSYAIEHSVNYPTQSVHFGL